jgi:GDP-D-mannose 3',5'-epimerase
LPILPAVLGGADILIAMIEDDAGMFSVPSKVLTYFCCGRPVLAAVPRGNLARRLVEREHAGLGSDPGSDAQFIGNLRRLAEDAAGCAKRSAPMAVPMLRRILQSSHHRSLRGDFRRLSIKRRSRQSNAGGRCMLKKTALVCGAGGFIGSHLVRRLKLDGFWVRGVDLKMPDYGESEADEFVVGDLRQQDFCARVIDRGFHEVYQLAADMGGAGYIFTGQHDADIIHNSATINLNVADLCRRQRRRPGVLFVIGLRLSRRQPADPDNPNCVESSAYPASPDSEYGWEKLISERLFQSYGRNYAMTCRIARYHNIFGPSGTWDGGKEKAPAAICRKVAQAAHGGEIEIWGDGRQTRSFLYIDECIEGTLAADAIGLRGAGQYRLRGDGQHQPTRRYGLRHRRQAAAQASCGGADRGSRADLRQQADCRDARLATDAEPDGRSGENLCLDREPAAAACGVTGGAPSPDVLQWGASGCADRPTPHCWC